ncbi:GNAT family N-acetyltransferase [Micromonospora sp. C31]|uniref:GNAT family N-acetyltransferase n=1 Tax=Micromonospora sp. C31 TaxID=2824876 RepID=UPI001B366415|nr:GNAT family N-acetyltransferase [Micromonospora sp. C31]MBQ1074315.1 GNAT family N-acetyltransferase [Micromonospora sp. C31]
MNVFLSTLRLVLREFTSADADLLVELDGDPEVVRYLTGGRATPPEAVRERVLPRILAGYRRPPGLGWWAALDRGSGDFLGWFEFRPTHDGDAREVELGYRLRRAAWGAGLATEGCRALIGKGFAELGVERVTANTMTVNAASRRVLEKSGLRLVRTYVGDWPEMIDGAEHGEVEYALTRERWLRRAADQV